MSHDLTHASFFSGVGGLDLGLERAGWRTVSFSEIDPYASAVLAQRWPGVPNLGSIVPLAERPGGDGHGADPASAEAMGWNGGAARADWQHATLWTGGFPCTDLSVAGKRAGFGLAHEWTSGRPLREPGRDSPDGGSVEEHGSHRTHDSRPDGPAFTDSGPTRSGLAFVFLELVGRYRPPIVLLENVPGLLSSHGGRDMAALLGALVELGYGVGYRVLDARHFGVPQRRRRVFIVGVTPGGRAGAERAAEVLSVGSRCRRHPPTGVEAGEGVAAGAGDGSAFAVRTGHQGATGWGVADGYTHTLASDAKSQAIVRPVGPPSDPDGVRAPDGLAGWTHDRGGVVNALAPVGGGPDDNDAQAGHLITHYRKSTRAASSEHDETWVPDDVTNTLNGFDVGDARAVELVTGGGMTEDPLLPLGLDSHRYRCCGNGVVADVAFWIGLRLRELVNE